METIQQQIGALQVIVAKQQVSVKRQRFAIIALAGIIVAGGFIAAVRPAADAIFNTITCKTWVVVDEYGKVRINAFTNPDGLACVGWLDKDGKVRINAFTNPDGQACVGWLDKDGKSRINASTNSDGQACVAWFDKDGKSRINAFTNPDGNAAVQWLDKHEKQRIAAGTLANGTVLLPTTDLTPPKKP